MLVEKNQGAKKMYIFKIEKEAKCELCGYTKNAEQSSYAVALNTCEIMHICDRCFKKFHELSSEILRQNA